MEKPFRLLLATFFATLGSASLHAKVSRISLSELVADSDFIGVVKVRSTSSSWFSDDGIATATVEEVWKGKKVSQVTFDINPSWTCDTSMAVKGERIVLFLSKGFIAHAGRGRLPIDIQKGIHFATFWPDIKMPDGLKVFDGPDKRYEWMRSVEIGDLREMVIKPQKSEGIK